MKQIHHSKPNKKPHRRSFNECRQGAPVLTFSATAWIKLQFLCHLGDTEVGAFGIASHDDVLYVEDVETVKQHCSCVSVVFDDEAVADFFDAQVEAGRAPEQFARIWLHTHPSDTPTPSEVDEDTFTRVFGRCNWAVMFILARGGQTFCRLRVGSVKDRGVAIASTIPVEVDYSTLAEIDFKIPIKDWIEEHERNVQPEPDPWQEPLEFGNKTEGPEQRHDFSAEDWVTCFDELDPCEQEEIFDELRSRALAGEAVPDED